MVINGPSSLRCEKIAELYNCRVFRCEVGEANVVNKGIELRNRGYSVPIIGEASNGGNIIYPSTVRDPLCSALSFIKALLFFEELNFSNEKNLENISEKLLALVQLLPEAASTEIEDPLAKFSLPKDLTNKECLEKIFYKTMEYQNEFKGNI